MIIRLIALLSLAAVAACSTVEGAGQDIQTAGDAISDTARSAEDEM